jgi:hypothetical protein
MNRSYGDVMPVNDVLTYFDQVGTREYAETQGDE